MKLFANQKIRSLFRALALAWAGMLFAAEGALWLNCHRVSFWLLLGFLAAGGGAGMALFRYFKAQHETMENAAAQIQEYLDGNRTARLECDEEGELYRLFHCVNALAAVLNAHAENEQREKAFLKNTISDISHQLKTPLAALNIYNGLMQDESMEPSERKEFVNLSEQELDRMEALVQSLLKMARLDAGSVVLEKRSENVAEILGDLKRHFAPRAKSEEKEIVLSGEENVFLCCDRVWVSEAVGNIIKNALDHTQKGCVIRLQWRALPSAVQILVRDNGCGIHPEDLPHIFKRFYRSRFSQDTNGVGLGLPLAKAIVEAHGGAIEVESERGRGTTFTLNFLIPTKL